MLSIYGEFRVPIAGTLVHPYLILLIPAAIFGQVNIFKQDWSICGFLFVYALFMFIPLLLLEGNYPEILKISAGILSFLFFAKVIKSERDFHYIAYAFILVTLVLSVRIFLLYRSGNINLLAGVNVLDEEGLGNKNAQSLYTLPGAFLLFYMLNLAIKHKKSSQALFWAGCIIPVALGVALSGNRSGYVSFLFIGLVFLMHYRINFSAIIAIVIAIIASYMLIASYASALVEHKLEQTTGGYVSDDQRKQLILNSIEVGIENPVIGLGLDGLRDELGRRLGLGHYIDPHNIYGYLFGGGGFLAFLGFMTFKLRILALGLKRRKLEKKLILYRLAEPISLWLAGYVLLYLLRSLFTREILYSPTFMGVLGLLFSAFFFYKKRASDLILQLKLAQQNDS